MTGEVHDIESLLAPPVHAPTRCGECEDDHIDVLLDRPFSYSPYDAASRDYDGLITNRYAPLVRAQCVVSTLQHAVPTVCYAVVRAVHDALCAPLFDLRPRTHSSTQNTRFKNAQVNRLPGLRGFVQPDMLRGGVNSPEAVGVYTADWQWAPCSYTHAQCADMFAKVRAALHCNRPRTCSILSG